MKTENAVLMKQARDSLTGKWGLAVSGSLIYLLIVVAVNAIPKAGGLISLIITGPIYLGFAMFILAISRNQNTSVDEIFQGFKRFGTAIITYLLILLFVVLWGLLLIIPGIIASISYSMTFYILVDNPSITPKEAIRKSKEMMMGNKWKYFKLGLRFIGWMILGVLSLGIGFLWITPYMTVTFAKFYDDIKTSKPEASPEVVPTN